MLSCSDLGFPNFILIILVFSLFVKRRFMISEKRGEGMYELYCKFRDKKGVKDSDVSKATGIPQSTFSDWKSGRSKPNTEKLIKIADEKGDVQLSMVALLLIPAWWAVVEGVVEKQGDL